MVKFRRKQFREDRERFAANGLVSEEDDGEAGSLGCRLGCDNAILTAVETAGEVDL